MRQWFQGGLVAGMVLLAAAPAARAAVDVELLLDKLVQKQVLTREEANELRTEMAEYKDANTQQLAKEVVPKWVQSLTLSGDVRLRQENFWRDPVTQNTSTTDPASNSTHTRQRQRMRLRFGAKAKVNDQVEAGLRFSTGTALDPVSINQTMQNTFDKKALFVDQAYVKLSTAGTEWAQTLPATVWGGKFESPFYSTGLVWDPDVTFEGTAVSVTPKWGPTDWFLTSGVFPIDEIATKGGDPVLYAGQVGTNWIVWPAQPGEWLSGLSLKGGLAYYDYANMENTVDTFTNQLGNTGTYSGGTAPSFTLFRPANDFNELDLLAEANTQLWGQPLKLHADYVKNTAVADNDKGFQLGAKLGKAERPGAWELAYYFQRLEPDAVFGLFADSDFGEGGTNRWGNVYSASIGTLKNSLLKSTLFVTNEVTGPTEDRAITRLQVDWVTKF